MSDERQASLWPTECGVLLASLGRALQAIPSGQDQMRRRPVSPAPAINADFQQQQWNTTISNLTAVQLEFMNQPCLAGGRSTGPRSATQSLLNSGHPAKRSSSYVPTTGVIGAHRWHLHADAHSRRTAHGLTVTHLARLDCLDCDRSVVVLPHSNQCQGQVSSVASSGRGDSGAILLAHH